MIYHFVVQYFNGGKEEPTIKELPPPPKSIDTTDIFGHELAACHRTLSREQQQVVREILPTILRIGSCSKPPKDWRSFWRATPYSPSNPHFSLVVRLWYSLASSYALYDAQEGNWHFASPGYTNLSAIRGMCWLYEEVFTQ